MKLKIDFGYKKGTTKVVLWHKPLEDFPKLMRFEGASYEWFMYDKDATGNVDFVLIYTKMKSYDPNAHATMPDFDVLFKNVVGETCECGARFTSFPQLHMRFCPKWRKI